MPYPAPIHRLSQETISPTAWVRPSIVSSWGLTFQGTAQGRSLAWGMALIMGWGRKAFCVNLLWEGTKNGGMEQTWWFEEEQTWWFEEEQAWVKKQIRSEQSVFSLNSISNSFLSEEFSILWVRLCVWGSVCRKWSQLLMESDCRSKAHMSLVPSTGVSVGAWMSSWLSANITPD